MPEAEGMDRLKIEEWYADSLRFTCFIADPDFEYRSGNWWEQAVGEPAATCTTKPRERSVVEEGEYQAGVLSLTVRPPRVDWRYRLPGIPDSLDTPPNVGSAPEAISAFRSPIEQWLSTKPVPQFARVAFGAVLFHRVATREDGYRQLAPYLARYLNVDANDSTDLVYQINRRRTVPVEGLERDVPMNRLMHWSVSMYQLQGITQMASRAPITSTSTVYACQLKLDINTVPSEDFSLAGDEAAAVLAELVRLGNEIAVEGDHP